MEETRLEDVVNHQFSIIDLKDKYMELMSEQVLGNFLKGDIAIEVYNQYLQEKEQEGKDRSKLVTTFLAETGENKSSFEVYKWIASIFPSQDLRSLPGMTWSHYRVCATTDSPIEWLIKAYDEGWSCKKLRDEIEMTKAGKAISSGVTCYICKGDIDMTKLITVSSKRKRYFFCSAKCAKEYIETQLNKS